MVTTKKMNGIIEKILTFLVLIALLLGWYLLCSLFVMFLWNWLMPVIFGIKTITWAQAFGLTLLSGILFGHVTSSHNK